MEQAKVRLYVDQPLAPGQAVALNGDQAHYLFAVMRLAVGARVALFNGRDGEWQARIAEAGKRDTLGRPTLFVTTDAFLRHFGISSLSELPQIDFSKAQDAKALGELPREADESESQQTEILP